VPVTELRSAGPATAWGSRPPLQVARVGAAYATIDGRILDAGGFDPPIATYDSAEVRRTTGAGVWRTVAPMGTPRANAAAAVLDGRVWVLGGYDDVAMLDSVQRYDPRTNTWSPGPALPEPRAQAGAAVLNGVLYLVGGDVPGGADEVRTASAIAFDPHQQRWTSIAPLPAARDRLRLVAAGHYLYAVGGTAAEGTSLSSVDRYDPRTGAWTSVAPMRESRAVPGVTVVQHGRERLIAAIGGCQFAAGALVQFRRTTELFNPVTGRWRLLPAQLPTGRCSLAAAAESNGTLLAIGGGSDIVAGGTATKEVNALTL
jgi:N-acetylneuraminic acid mutarotase